MSNCTIILFGATGDLSRRKLIPALYTMVEQGKLRNFALVGTAIEDIDPKSILDKAREFIPEINEDIWSNLLERTRYQKINFIHQEDYKKLKELVEKTEKEFGLSGNRLFYLAAAAHHFCPITYNLAETKLIKRFDKRSEIWNRIVYEKPFGYDLKSAREINTCIDKYLNESQIYRIDHFLTKELVSNIALIRFTNCVFEPLWNNRYIDQVQIILNEEVGLEGRALYYDKYGALPDVVQNHMLELLALIGMESPEKLTGDYIRAERAKVLKYVRVVDGILGQYKGYKDEPNVEENSKTETFAALFLMIDNIRWAGVPFYLKTGKNLSEKKTVIHIKFKQVDCLLTRCCPVPSNWLTINVTQEETFSLRLNAKKPGESEELIPIDMEFCHSCVFGPQKDEQAYETLLQEVIKGEQSISVRFDEIEYAWRIVDKMRLMDLPLFEYEPKSNGPEEMKYFENNHGMRWRS